MGTKALILAAGMGTRLRPITDFLPKALIPYFGPSLLDYAIDRVRAAGIDAIAVNTHHLAQSIAKYLERPGYGQIHVSFEPTLLGTGGALNPLRAWLGADDLLIVNADIITDLNLGSLLQAHQQGARIATMAFLETAKTDKTPVWVKQGLVRSIGNPKEGALPGATAHTFACAHVLSAKFLERLTPSGAAEIMPVYREWLTIDPKAVGAWFHSGHWHDLGTPAELWQAYAEGFADFASTDDRYGIKALSMKLNLAPGTCLIDKRVFASAGVKLSATAPVFDLIAMPGAKIPRQRELGQSIIGPGYEIGLQTNNHRTLL